MSKRKSKRIISSGMTPRLILQGFMASANACMKKIRFEELINEAVVWYQTQWHVSSGNLLKALILNTFTDRRTPLYKLFRSL